MNTYQTEKIKASIAFTVITLIVLITGIVIFKYQIEGETNMPFVLSRVYVVSTAEGAENEDSTDKWNLDIYQNSDIYFTIEKNANVNSNDRIRSVQISNIQIIKVPTKGEIKVYMPNSSDGRMFTYSNDLILDKNTLTYTGATKTDTKTLEIGNQGGTIAIRFSNTELGKYISNEDEEIKHDGTMLNKIDVSNEDLKYIAQFDFIINIEDKSYKSTIQVELPVGNIVENGTEYQEINNTKEYVFKRI